MDDERYNILKEKWNVKTGEFFTQELPTIIMSSATCVSIQKLAESIGGSEGAAVIFYEAGKKMGTFWTISWKEDWELEGQEFINKLEEFIAELGWGKCSIDMQSLAIKVENSFIAKNYGESEVPVCHFLRGYYAGMGAILAYKELDGEERKCAACGDECCEFVLTPVE